MLLLGFTLLGVIINTYLTGVIMAQFSTYLTQDLPGYEDPLWAKCLVAFLFVVNISQAAAVAYMAWFYCVTNFANPNIVYYNLWAYPFTALSEFRAASSRATRTNLAATAVLAITNQMFQTWKIYLFTRNKTFVVFLTATSMAACGLGIAVAVKSWFIVEFPKLTVLEPIVEANLALQCAVDVIIASFFALGTLFSVRFSTKTYTLALFVLPIGRIYTHTIMDHFVCREQFQHIPTNNGDIMSVPHFHIRPAGINGSSGVIESISLGSIQTPVPKVSEGLHAENCGDLGGC
ncbi:hypothetical protein C8R45DRAFT_928144 [Mycena sanguinolenta]|nr:hypothetical protein C8R45DRAFT_928144 [Mycena sanguinolenta]